jgi:hypothetical protein
MLEVQGGICGVGLPWRASTGLRERGIRRRIFQGYTTVVQLASQGVGVRRHFRRSQVVGILMRRRMRSLQEVAFGCRAVVGEWRSDEQASVFYDIKGKRKRGVRI